nr:MAG TPA: hypothetical protein [Caudoviricetes sp.]
MINLVQFRRYWESVSDRIASVTGVLPVTIDKEMGKKIQALPVGSLTIFVFPPLADSDARNPDSFREDNKCVIFVMKKYNPQRQSAFSLLEETQPAVEEVKRLLLADHLTPCSPLVIDTSSIETAPETELYGTFAGWSVAFNAKTSGL